MSRTTKAQRELERMEIDRMVRGDEVTPAQEARMKANMRGLGKQSRTTTITLVKPKVTPSHRRALNDDIEMIDESVTDEIGWRLVLAFALGSQKDLDFAIKAAKAEAIRYTNDRMEAEAGL